MGSYAKYGLVSSKKSVVTMLKLILMSKLSFKEIPPFSSKKWV